jgi:beta-aspartyl-peptidase (threonine type)
MHGTPTILVHAGAGAFGSDLREHRGEVIAMLQQLLRVAAEQLQSGADAVTVARTAVEAMEDFELFNAGYGAALCADGSVELSAALMRGHDQAAGAVAGVRTLRHPIRAAEIVLRSRQVLLIGEPADELAGIQAADRWPSELFVTERQRARLQASSDSQAEDRGTVGAVCLDGAGRLAAATSTGGITGQPPGRVGDSPLIGAGTWADQQVAVSCTGAGEAFIRAGVARGLAALVQSGETVEQAARRTLADVGRLGGDGGLTALDSAGRFSMPFTTEAMPRGVWRQGGPAQIDLY